jgi:hypothetical protein
MAASKVGSAPAAAAARAAAGVSVARRGCGVGGRVPYLAPHGCQILANSSGQKEILLLVKCIDQNNIMVKYW